MPSKPQQDSFFVIESALETIVDFPSICYENKAIFLIASSFKLILAVIDLYEDDKNSI